MCWYVVTSPSTLRISATRHACLLPGLVISSSTVYKGIASQTVTQFAGWIDGEPLKDFTLFLSTRTHIHTLTHSLTHSLCVRVE